MNKHVHLEQLVLGPRAAGRDFGAVAATPTLTLSDEALSATLDFNLALGDHVRGRSPIRAFFPISAPPARPLWFLSTTTDHGKIAGNPVWMTWGQVIDAQQLGAMAGRAHRLLQFQNPRDLPEAGTLLPPFLVKLAELDGAPLGPGLNRSATWRLQPDLGHIPLVVDVEAPMDATATLVSILDAALEATRSEISFVNAPVALRHWDLICYQREEWKRSDVWRPGRARLHSVSGAGELRGDPSDAADLLWWKLRSALARLGGEESGGLLHALLRGRPSAESGDTVENRLAAGLRGALSTIREHSGLDASAAVMAALMDAIAGIAEDEPRALLSAALRRVYGEWVQSEPGDAARLELYYRRPNGVREQLGWPPLLLPRLAAAGMAAGDLDSAILRPIAPDMIVTFPGLLLKQANSAPPGRLDSEAELLAQSLQYCDVKKASDTLAPLWELAYAYYRRVVQAWEKEFLGAPDSPGRQKAKAGLTAFMLQLNCLGNLTQMKRILSEGASVKAANMIGEADWRQITENREQTAAAAVARDRLASLHPTRRESAWAFAFQAYAARSHAS